MLVIIKQKKVSFLLTIVGFPKFVEILFEIARLRNPKMEDNVAINELLKVTLLKRGNVNYQEKSKFEDWFIELEKPSVIDYLNSQSSFFLTVTLFITLAI